MSFKKSFPILVILSIIPILQGYDSNANMEYGTLLMKYNLSNLHLGYYRMAFTLASMIGALIGGMAVDKWNLRRLAIIILIALSSSSLVLQFYDSFVLIFIHRCILGFSFGFLVLSFQVFLVDIASTKHRGKILFIFLGASIIGSLIYLAFRYFFVVKSNTYSLTYPQYQIPYIVLPLLIFFVIRYLPGTINTDSEKVYPFKYLFRPKQKVLIYAMVILAILTSLANSNLYIYVSSQIVFDNNAEFLYLIPMIIGVAATVLGIVTIDVFGRKSLLKFGIIALIISATTNILIPLITKQPMVILGFLHLYYFIFQFTIITTSTIIILEYLPKQIRGRGMILFAIIYSVPNGINNFLNKTFIFESNYNVIISSLIILTTLIICLMLIRKHLIETKGLLFNEIKSRINIE